MTGRWGISRIVLHKLRVEVNGDRSRVHVTTFITYGGARGGGGVEQSMTGTTAYIWDSTWIKRDGRWLILSVPEPKQGFEL